MQVYRYMDIGTAKPSARFRRTIPHHVVDILDPARQFNAGMFVEIADKLVPEISERGHIPVIAGGTAFYFVNFVLGLPDTPPGNPEIRRKIEEESEILGLEELYRELQEKDAAAAAAIELQDRYRIIRALEIVRTTGKPRPPRNMEESRSERYRFLSIGLTRPRDELYRRIDKRVETMFDNGLVDEVKDLIARGYREHDPGMKGIGYREFFSYRNSGCLTIPRIREMIQRSSRRYAKRQITFFKKLPGVEWFSLPIIIPQ